jgi:uncharacterized protein
VMFSRFAHSFHEDGRCILYHALNFNRVECTEEDAKVLTGEDAFSSKNGHEYERLIKELRDKKLIVNDPDEDAQMLKTARFQIMKPYVTTAYFFITNHCNLACTYCFEKQSEPGFFHKDAMTPAIALQGLHFFSSLVKLQPGRYHDKKTIIFYGGEPLMNRDVLRFTVKKIAEFKKMDLLPHKTKIIVVTNGTLIDDEDIRFFQEHDITLTFSIDGDGPATENRVYPDGKPAFEKIAGSYARCRDAGLDLNVACTLTPRTLERMEESVNFLVNGLRIKNIGFNLLLDNGLIDVPPGYDEAAADFVADAGQILNSHQVSENRNSRRQQVFARKQPCIFDCNAQGGRQIAIAPGGQVGICHEHITDRQHFVTTVFDTFNPEKDPVFLEWNLRSPLYINQCLDCPALGVCGGGCVINSERATGSIWNPDPRFCMQTLKLLERMVLK